MTPKLLVARLRDAIQRLGAPGMVALLLWLVAIVAGLVVAPRLAADNRAFAAGTTRLAQAAAAPAARERHPRYDAADPAAALVGQLPEAGRLRAAAGALSRF